MESINPVLPLCTFSEAEGGRYEKALCLHQDDGCPLGLNRAEGRHCPCRQRVTVERFDSHDVQVLSCCFPKTYSGTTIRDPEEFARWIRRQHQRRLDEARRN